MDRSKKTLSELAIPIGAIHSRAMNGGRANRVLRERPVPPQSAPLEDSAMHVPMAPAVVAPGMAAPAWSAAQSNGDRSRSGYVSKAAKAELEELEDAELLRRFQLGEETAFYVIFERRHKEIYTHCYRMCNRDGEKANDAFQDTFMKVFTRKDLFTDATNGRAWLYRIATNTCLNAHRYDRRHPTEGLEDTVKSVDPRYQPDFGTEQNSLREALEAAMAQLPDELRQPFILRELDELSYEDVAEQLGITIAAARQRIYRAKILLREELEDLVN